MCKPQTYIFLPVYPAINFRNVFSYFVALGTDPIPILWNLEHNFVESFMLLVGKLSVNPGSQGVSSVLQFSKLTLITQLKGQLGDGMNSRSFKLHLRDTNGCMRKPKGQICKLQPTLLADYKEWLINFNGSVGKIILKHLPIWRFAEILVNFNGRFG